MLTHDPHSVVVARINVLNGVVSVRNGREDYAVVIDAANFAVDHVQIAELRRV